MALSGSVATNHFSDSTVAETWMTFSWSATQSIKDNYSRITWQVVVGRENSNWVYIYNPTVTVNGSKQTKSTAQFKNGNVIFSGSFDLSHSNSGEASFSMSMSGNVYYSGGGTVSANKSWTLNTIPRNSTTSSAPNWTAPNSVTCSINRQADFTHTVVLQLKDSNGNWVDAYALYDQGTSATFGAGDAMKRVFEILATRGSCAARFAIGTNGPGGWTNGPEGTCTAANVNTISAPNFTATDSATVTINKGHNDFTTGVKVLINGQDIGKTDPISGTSFTFNNTTELRTRCFKGLAQEASRGYTVKATTYYLGVQVRGEQSVTPTCNAPRVDTVTTPNFTAGNSFTCNVSTVNSGLSRKLTFQIQNSSGTWVTIADQGTTSTTSFTWANTEAQRDTIFGALSSNATRPTRILTTTYYNGVQVRGANVSTGGTCTAPAASTCNKPNWTAGSTFTCNITRASNLLTHTIVLRVRDVSGDLQTLQTITKSSSTSISLANTTDLNTTLFRLLAQSASKETSIAITTYYKDIKIRDTITSFGTLTAPAASTCTTTPNWTGGDSLTLNINRAHSSFTHTVVVKVNSQTITTLTGVGTSTSFGTSASDRTNIYTALAQASSKSSSVTVTTYYNGVQVRSATTKTGTCSAPGAASPSAPTWTAGNSFNAAITLSKSYLVYSIELKVGSTSVQSYSYQTATSLGFAGSVAINLKAYQGLNKNAQATSQFIVKMYYKKSDGTYIQVGPAATTNGTCTALEANNITAPNWTAGSSFNATVTRKSLNLYSTVILKVNGQTVQELTYQNDSSNLNYVLTFANTEDANKKIYTALAQAASKTATLEITSYYGNDSSKVQVRTPIQVNGICNASAPVVGKLTLNPTSAIIDNTVVTCALTIPLSTYTSNIEVSFNGTLIKSFTDNTSNQVTFNSASYVANMYKAIPAQTSGELEFKITTYYKGVQVQQPQIIITNLKAKEATIGIKINDTLKVATTATIENKNASAFIDNTSMIGSSKSRLTLTIPKGFFYLEAQYGGYIKQIKVQIANSSSMLKLYNYTSSNIVYNDTKSRIVNPAFESTSAIIMGPYDFPSVTKAGAINNLVITATDSRDYTVTETIPLTIFPYSAPTIKINNEDTDRIENASDYVQISLNGTVSSLYTGTGSTKVQTNTLQKITLEYKVYGYTGNYTSYSIPLNASGQFSYGNDYTTFKIDKFSTATSNPGITFNINDTFQLLITVEDKFGEKNSDSIIILPNRPLLSFRTQQIGINTIPRKKDNITERVSEEGEHPSLDVNGYIYSNGREVPTFSIVSSWTV